MLSLLFLRLTLRYTEDEIDEKISKYRTTLMQEYTRESMMIKFE
jgi:hypothetical protein